MALWCDFEIESQKKIHNSADLQDFTTFYNCKAITYKEHIILVYFRKTSWFAPYTSSNWLLKFSRYLSKNIFQSVLIRSTATFSQRWNFFSLFNRFLGNQSYGWIFLAKYCGVNTFDWFSFIYLKILICFTWYTSMVHCNNNNFVFLLSTF